MCHVYGCVFECVRVSCKYIFLSHFALLFKIIITFYTVMNIIFEKNENTYSINFKMGFVCLHYSSFFFRRAVCGVGGGGVVYYVLYCDTY